MVVDLRCDRVSKRYRVPGPRRFGSFVRALPNALAAPRHDFWALRDVSFDVTRGEAFGILGRNGAGKSTILKLLGGITERLPSMAEFAGVEPFMDMPVKFYSSGMYVRLGFAIAVHLEPEVLLVDEVLAVGDAEFQARCLRRIEELKRRGVTMIFVSHDLGAVEQIGDRDVLIESGRL